MWHRVDFHWGSTCAWTRWQATWCIENRVVPQSWWSPSHATDCYSTRYSINFIHFFFSSWSWASHFLGWCTCPVQNTNGAWLASAITAEKLDEFGNTVQPWWPHGQSQNTHIKCKDAAKDVDTDVDDEDFVSSSSSDVGSSDSEVREISNEEVRTPSTKPFQKYIYLQIFPACRYASIENHTWKARAAHLSQRPRYWWQVHQRKR